MSDGKPTTPPTAGAGGSPAVCTTTPCPLEQQIELVELVEVLTHAGAEKKFAVGARDQYINLDDKVQSAAPHPEYRRAIQFKARVKWKAGDTSRSLAGQTVYWYATANGSNKAGLAAAEKQGFDSAGGAMKKTTTTDAAGWTGPVDFFLSLYGGDKFDISATDDGGYKGGLKAGTYTVWRRFWYHVTEMKTSTTGKFDVPSAVSSAFEAGYKTVFMEFLEASPRTEATYVSDLANGTARANEAKKYFTADDRSPFKCHIMTVDYSQTGTTTTTVTDTAPGNSYTTPSWNVLWRHGAGLPWKVSAQWRPAGGAWSAIPDAKLSTSSHSSQPGFKKVTVDLSSLSPAPTAAAPADIRLELKVAGPNFSLGWGGGSHHLFLCTGTLRDIMVAADHNPIQRSDAVHEIGHALGLVNMSPAASGAHTAWEDTAHKNHCSKPGTQCAMFWESSTTRLTTFHLDAGAGCHDYLRRQDFSRSVMENQWKD